MAKISARGDREVARRTNGNGGVMVLTEQGRLLRKLTPTTAYNLLGKVRGDAAARLESFNQMAATYGYEERP